MANRPAARKSSEPSADLGRAADFRQQIRDLSLHLPGRRDLDGKWLVVAAATPEVNRDVARAAEERRIFVNAVDDVSAATAYLGGVVRKGGVTLAVSTDGRAPALAGLLREALAAVLPDDIDRWTHTASQARAFWKAARVPIEERRPLLLEALNELYLRRRPA